MWMAVLHFQPRMSLKNASTPIILCIMGFEEICPFAILVIA